MIAARRFSILHTPFTGASFLRRALALHAPDAWGVRLLPFLPGNPQAGEASADHVRFLPVLGPWEWYVAWYARQRLGTQRDGLFPKLSENGTLPFEATLERVFEWETARTSGIGLYTMTLQQAAGRFRDSVRPLKVESLRTDLAAALRDVEAVDDATLARIVDTPDVAVDRHPYWARFHTERTRALIEAHDGAAMAELGYEWPANTAEQAAPGAIRPTQGVSIPRSGHSALFSALFHYFREELVFCDAERIEQCGCGHVPCVRAETNLAKNHDFGLLKGGAEVPIREGIHYLIQYRNPVRSIVSNYQLHLRGGHADTREEWERFRDAQVGYWNRFMDKWVFGPQAGAPNMHLCAYHDLVLEPARTVAACIEFMTGAPPVPGAVETIVETVGLQPRDNLGSFAYYDEGEFRALEAATGDRMQRAGIPRFDEGP